MPIQLHALAVDINSITGISFSCSNLACLCGEPDINSIEPSLETYKIQESAQSHSSVAHAIGNSHLGLDFENEALSSRSRRSFCHLLYWFL